MKKLNLVGLKFGKLTVVSELEERNPHGKVLFHCKCDCGNEVNVIGSKLKNGWSKSCSCLQKETVRERSKIDNKKHGYHKTSIYNTYYSMISRCYNNKNESYQYYGEKGIKVCDRWLESFENFLADMGEKPSENHSIDRINVFGNYEPLNCRWADKIEQENNKTTNVLIEYQSKKYTISELARLLNINYHTLRNRTVKKNIFTYE